MGRALLILVVHDLRQRLRDRSVLIFGLLVPFSLAFVFSLAFAGLEDVELEPVTVAVAAPDGDEYAAALVGTLQALPAQDLPVTVRRAAADEVPGLVDTGEAGVGAVLPEGFGSALSGGPAPDSDVVIRVGPDAGLSGDVVADIVRSVVAQMNADAAALTAAGDQAGLSEQELGALAQELGQVSPEVAWTGSQVEGEDLSFTSGIVSGQAGMFLFFTVGFAVLTLLTEREWGILARLRSLPVPRWLVPLSKAVVAVLLGVASTSTLLLAGGAFLDGVHFGSWWVVLPLVVAVVVAATSVMFIIVKVARTSEQAGMAMSVIAISLGVAGGSFFRLPADGWVAQVVQINPVAALTRGLGISAGGGGLADLTPVLLSLLAFTAVVLLLARVLPNRKDAL
ncbi:ABC transporter permease [Ornithinimicrobium sufpigmenti]|uniref:ABC transporter permease n=1 Tax=Ornithinimicrobium sufpigmenti TaxID=2508882 RepID=UPI0010357ACC|nr:MULTISPECIES: ABC transporter permease [unclassified Ornithinimicrobium]